MQAKYIEQVHSKGPQCSILSRNKLSDKYFSINLYKNTCFKKNFKEKSNNFEMQCIVRQSRCIALHFQLLQLVRLTGLWSTFYETRINRLTGQHLFLNEINKKRKENMKSTVHKQTVQYIVYEKNIEITICVYVIALPFTIYTFLRF